MQFTALVPLKRDSRRLPNKNYLKLAGKPLTYHIFNALLKLESVEKVCAFSSSDDCMSHIPSGVEFVKRDPKLDLDSVRGLDLLRAFAETVPSQYYILAHATSPFISAASLQKGINGILSGQYDSALAVSEIKKYFWFDSRPVNYDINDIVQTQYIQPVLIETSAFYMFSRDDILLKSRRIGDRPYLVPTNEVEAMDIDYIHEYLMARRFQDLLAEEQEPWRQSGGNAVSARSSVPLTIRLILFELEDILSGPEGEIPEYVEQWLNILVEQGKKISVITRMDHERASSMLQRLGVDMDLVLTIKDGMTDDRVAELAREGCLRKGVSPHQSAYVSASPHACRIAELAGLQYFHAGWACTSSPDENVTSFENFSDAAIHFLECGRW